MELGVTILLAQIGECARLAVTSAISFWGDVLDAALAEAATRGAGAGSASWAGDVADEGAAACCPSTCPSRVFIPCSTDQAKSFAFSDANSCCVSSPASFSLASSHNLVVSSGMGLFGSLAVRAVFFGTHRKFPHNHILDWQFLLPTE